MVNGRRPAHRFLLAAIALAVGFCLYGWSPAPHAARADMFFCEDDPAVFFNGVKVDITVGVAADGVARIRDSVPVLILVPAGVDAQLISVSHQYFNEQVYIVPSDGAGSLSAGLPREDG